MNEIMVTWERDKCFRAYFVDDPTADAVGSTPAEAIGYLVSANRHTFRCFIDTGNSVPLADAMSLLLAEYAQLT